MNRGERNKRDEKEGKRKEKKNHFLIQCEFLSSIKERTKRKAKERTESKRKEIKTRRRKKGRHPRT